MTAVERLAVVLASVMYEADPISDDLDDAGRLLAADHHLASDIEDGAALRRLREAHSGTWSLHVVRSAGRVIGYTVEAWSTGTWPAVKVYGPDESDMPDVFPTIAQAADACREAIEAQR